MGMKPSVLLMNSPVAEYEVLCPADVSDNELEFEGDGRAFEYVELVDFDPLSEPLAKK